MKKIKKISIVFIILIIALAVLYADSVVWNISSYNSYLKIVGSR